MGHTRRRAWRCRRCKPVHRCHRYQPASTASHGRKACSVLGVYSRHHPLYAANCMVQKHKKCVTSSLTGSYTALYMPPACCSSAYGTLPERPSLLRSLPQPLARSCSCGGGSKMARNGQVFVRNDHVRVWAVWAMRGGVHGAAGAASWYTGAIGTNRHQQPPMGAGMQRVGRI